MLKAARLEQLVRLIHRSDWEVLLLYGHGWRKDFVRFLLDLNYLGPHAVAAVAASGEVIATVADRWDYELVREGANGIGVELSLDLEDTLRRKGYRKVAVAGLEFMEARFVQALAESNGHPPVSATAAVERLRMVKTEDEIRILRRAAHLADRGYHVFVEAIEVGMAEYELVAEVEAFLKSQGAEDNFMLISSGGTEVRGMKPPTERRFQPGDVVATELTPQVQGYYAQICRTLIMGEPTPAQREGFDIFFRAQEAAQSLLKPGVNISEVARAENDVFRRAGLGEYTGPRYTRVRGHGLGLFVDEYPQILEEVDCRVEEGMVLIPHPNTYLPTVGYMVFGEALVVTPGGCESLSGTEKKLFQKGL